MKLYSTIIICTLFLIDSFSMAGQISPETKVNSERGPEPSPFSQSINSGINNYINVRIHDQIPSITHPSNSAVHYVGDSCPGAIIRVGSKTHCNYDGSLNGATFNQDGIVDTSASSTSR